MISNWQSKGWKIACSPIAPKRQFLDQWKGFLLPRSNIIAGSLLILEWMSKWYVRSRKRESNDRKETNTFTLSIPIKWYILDWCFNVFYPITMYLFFHFAYAWGSNCSFLLTQLMPVYQSFGFTFSALNNYSVLNAAFTRVFCLFLLFELG